jgi:hypothetical protein
MDAVGSFLAGAVRYLLGHHTEIFLEVEKMILEGAALVFLLIGLYIVIKIKLQAAKAENARTPDKKRAATKEQKSATKEQKSARIVGKRTRNAKSAIRKVQIGKRTRSAESSTIRKAQITKKSSAK